MQEDFRYFLDKAVVSLYNNPDQSITLTQNLMMNDKNPDNTVVYQNIVGQSYALKGDFLNSIKSTLGNASQQPKNISDFHQFFLDYCLADQYQNLGLYGQSQIVISNILEKNNFPKHPETAITLAKIYQLKAINNVVVKNYPEAVKFLEKSNSYLTLKNEENEILKTENQLFLGIILINQQKLELAKPIFDSVLKSKTVQKSDFLFALARENMARLYFLQQNYYESIVLLTEAFQKIKNKDYQQLQNRIYDGFSKAYLAQNNQEEYKKYRNLYNETKDKLDKNKKTAISYLVSSIEDINNEKVTFHKGHTKKRLVAVSVFSALLLLTFFGLYYSADKKEKELKRQLVFFEKIKEKSLIKNSEIKIPASEPIVEIEPKKGITLSPERESELLQKLNDFEQSQLFLSNQMSLPLLASELDTNIKYLSEIIRKYKDKKFNAYINDLRIQYIVNLLKTDPAYLNYKVSYLAEISGFSSHSAFTAIFKVITGMSPNDFIQQLNQIKKG